MGTTLPDRLETDADAVTVSAFPDGSVDTFYDVYADGERVATRQSFAAVVADAATDSFTVRPTAVEPGGHALNTALQAHRLGDDVGLAGHLDDDAFDDLPFETVSMGAPSRVSIYGFDDGDALAVEPSPDLESWTLATLLDAVDDEAAFLEADAVCCANWTTAENMPSALASLAERGVDGGWFLFDPGFVPGRPDADVARLFDALGRLTDSYDVVLAANPHEIADLGAALGFGAADTDETLAALRERADLAGVVLHGESRAAAATADGVTSEQNFEVDPTRHTGGGDRFDAGLAHALARGWEWSDALRLGNACASRYIATGETGTAKDLAAFLREQADSA